MLEIVKLLPHVSEKQMTHNGTAIQNRSYSPPNHSYILLPTPFSSGCCYLPSWPVSPQTRGLGRYVVQGLSFAKHALCLQCI